MVCETRDNSRIRLIDGDTPRRRWEARWPRDCGGTYFLLREENIVATWELRGVAVLLVLGRLIETDRVNKVLFGYNWYEICGGRCAAR